MFLLQVNPARADCRAGSTARDQQSPGVILLMPLQVVRSQNKGARVVMQVFAEQRLSTEGEKGARCTPSHPAGGGARATVKGVQDQKSPTRTTSELLVFI